MINWEYALLVKGADWTKRGIMGTISNKKLGMYVITDDSRHHLVHEVLSKVLHYDT